MRLSRLLTAILLLAPVARGAAQASGGTIVIVTGQQATLPIPTLIEGPAATTANYELADQLFLHLAITAPGRPTAGDAGFIPQLAERWERRDSVTLVFDIDPRARWHDGVPVTARDVVFTFRRARDPKIAPSLSNLLRNVESVTAEGERRVVFRYRSPYSEQLFDAAFYVAPIPAHLLESLPPDSMARSAYARHPVGSGPYRWVRSEPGQFIELAAFDGFHLGRAGTSRMVFRTVTDADARMNLLLGGEGDAMASVIPPLTNRDRIAARGEMRLVTTPSNTVAYLLFNQRAPGDSTRPHPILSDVRVRRALVAGLDRQAMVRTVFGQYARVAYGPASTSLWISALAPKAAPRDLPRARRLLAEAGWRDTDNDGVLDRDGRPLELTVTLPTTSQPRRQMAAQAQEQLRQLGVRLEVQALEGPVWGGRHSSGNFDISFGSATQIPSPSGLSQSWSCRGGTNVARYCNPAVDSLISAAVLSQSNPSPLWREVLRRIEADAPAAFLYAPVNVVAVHRRFERVQLRADSPWLLAHEWRVRRGAALPRDAAR